MQKLLATKIESTKKYFEFVLALIAFALPSIICIPWIILAKISDFFQYYAASLLMKYGYYSHIYDIGAIIALQYVLVHASLHPQMPFLVPPVLAWTLFPLAWFKFKIILYVWTILMAGLILVSGMMLCQLLQIPGISRLWLMLLLGALGPCIDSIRLGQLGPILLFGITCLIAGWLRKNFWLMLFGQSLLWFKPHLGLPLLLFEAGAGKKKFIAGNCLVIITGLLISTILGGGDVLLSYWRLVTSRLIQSYWLCLQVGPTLRGQLIKFSVDYDAASIIALLAYLILLGCSFYLGRLVKDDRKQIAVLISSILPLSLCFSLHLLAYDLLLLFPAIPLLLSWTLKGSVSKLRWLLIVLLSSMLFLPGYIYLNYFYVLKGSLINPFFWGVLIFAIGSLRIVLSNGKVIAK